MPTAARAPRALRLYSARTYSAADSVGYLLHQLATSMRRQVALAMAAHELTAAQWYPLWKLRRDGPCSAQELARDMDIDAGAATRLVDRLVAKGLVKRARDSADRRVTTLALEPAGEAVAACVPQVLCDVNNACLRGFDRDEWQQLLQLLRRMLANGPGGARQPGAPRRAARKGPTLRSGRRPGR